jgi:hypothetical protein
MESYIVEDHLHGMYKWFLEKEEGEEYIKDKDKGIKVKKGPSYTNLKEEEFPEVFNLKTSLTLEMLKNTEYSAWRIENEEYILIEGGPAHMRTAQLYLYHLQTTLKLIEEKRVRDQNITQEENLFELYHRHKWNKIKRIFIHNLPPYLEGKGVCGFDPRKNQKKLTF